MEFFSSPAYKQHSRRLRSSNTKTLFIPRSYLVSMGDRAFSIYAPKLWSTLDSDLVNSSSLTIFKSKLKTKFFNEYFNPS